MVVILIYVDDLLVAAATKAAAESAMAEITDAFKAREMGKPSVFLGFHIVQDAAKGTLQVGQHQYVATLLERFGLDKANPVRLPMGFGARLTKDGQPLMGKLIKTYQELVGSLLYLATGTRPDISVAVGQLARHVSAPTMEHLAAAKVVLRYLKGTESLGQTYGIRSRWSGTVTQTAPGTWTCDGPRRDTCLFSTVRQSVGRASDSHRLHTQQQRRNTSRQQPPQRRLYGCHACSRT